MHEQSPIKVGSKVLVAVLMFLIQILVTLYSILTLPIYYYIQKPWLITEESKRTKAKQIDPTNPYSPWVRTKKPIKSLIEGCENINDLFDKIVQRYGDKEAFGSRPILNEFEDKQSNGRVFRKFVLGDYQWINFNQAKERVAVIASGFSQQGIKHGDIVILMSDTRLEWMLSALALSKIGATVATLYATLGEEGIIHGINETEVTHIVTSHDQLPKLLKVLPQTPLIRRIIYFEGFKKVNLTFPENVKLTTFSQVEKSGMENRITTWPKIRSSETFVLMYTSGSTGIPKGVMISHQNLLSSSYAYCAVAERFSQRDVCFGYLPLAHVLELAGEFFFLSLGMAIGYGSPLTMTDKSTGIKKGCPGDMTLLKPTIVTGVPLVLDRMTKGINEEIESKGYFAKKLFQYVIDYKRHWLDQGYQTPIVNRLVCNKIKQILGGRVRYLAIGGAPLRPDTHKFFEACMDVQVLQGYGLTEVTAAGTLMDYDELSSGRVGAPLSGVQIRLVDWLEGNYRVQDKPYPRGEIVIGGSLISKGYYKNDKLTQEAYSEENGVRWFHTGDIGEVYPDGTIKIVDRRKDLVKLQFGEYISLGKVESELKGATYVDNLCVIGDSLHDHLIALVVPNPKTIKTLAETFGKGHLSYKELCKDEEITKAVTKDIIDFARKQGLNKMEIPVKIHLCSDEWLPDSGLVTAALKIRRRNIHDFYKSEIRNLYNPSSNRI